MDILVKLSVSFFSYPLHPASPQAMLQRLNPAWTQVIDQPDLSSPVVEPDLSPNPTHDPTWLTEQLDLDAASLLPYRVPLGQATPLASCHVVPMLNLASDNPAHLT
jgi:hypothetical protein